jgi:FMN-dependent oxidoreductase (nitrilotriacetate monooxygenase family)
VPVGDPTLVVPAMAAVTEHLGFGITVSLTYEQPYKLARQFGTLDHLTGGRVAWNIVTSYLQSAAINLGLERQMPHDERYAVADEFLEVCYKLWESSWDDAAVALDRERGVFADPAAVHPIEHHGRYFDVPGIALTHPSPQRTPVLYQAGSSERGRAFAARHAECVFVNGGAKTEVARLVADLRAQAAPRPILVFVGATVITGADDAAAEALFDEYRAHASIEGALAHASASLGIDFAAYDWDEPIGAGSGRAITSNVDAAKRAAGDGFTKRQFVDRLVLGSRQVPIVGGPETVADALIDWVETADVDGFNLSRTVMPECLEAFIDHVVPVLQARGVYKTGYGTGTYRERLFGAGSRLPATHPAAAYRWTPS